MEYRDSYEEEERTLDLHIAKLCEVMEWEATLPLEQRSKRRLVKYISHLPMSAEAAAKFNQPWLMLGCLERIIHHANIVFGSDWIQQANRQRAAFFESEEDAAED